MQNVDDSGNDVELAYFVNFCLVNGQMESYAIVVRFSAIFFS